MADNEQQALAEDLEGGATGLVDTLTGPQRRQRSSLPSDAPLPHVF